MLVIPIRAPTLPDTLMLIMELATAILELPFVPGLKHKDHIIRSHIMRTLRKRTPLV